MKREPFHVERDGPARGCVLGLFGAVGFWLVIGLVAYLVLQ